MVAAIIISSLISGKGKVPNMQTCLTPQGLMRRRQERDCLAVRQIAAGFALRAAPSEEDNPEAIPKGCAAIVTINGKSGLYKDEGGKLYVVSVKCPHLGCQLWNPDELSWDCPCHGSRFTYDGKH